MTHLLSSRDAPTNSSYHGPQVRDPPDAYVTHTYDASNNLTGIINGRPGGWLASRFTYTYDGLGNRLTQLDLGGVQTDWSYDATYQLTGEVRGGINAFDLEYEYDPAGNRTRETNHLTAAVTDSMYDGANQLLYSDAILGRDFLRAVCNAQSLFF